MNIALLSDFVVYLSAFGISDISGYLDLCIVNVDVATGKG